MFTRYRYLCKSIDLQISTVDLKKWGGGIIGYSIPPVQNIFPIPQGLTPMTGADLEGRPRRAPPKIPKLKKI